MSNNFYTTKTAALKATTADIRNLKAQEITINGVPIIRDVADLRGDNATQYDIWPNGVQKDNNGKISIYPLGYNKLKFIELSDEQKNAVRLCSRIIDNICYDENGEIICYFYTNSLLTLDNYILNENNWSDWENTEDGKSWNALFSAQDESGEWLSFDNLKEIKSNFSSLITAYCAFDSCPNLETFEGDLTSLKDGCDIFCFCEKMASFHSDLSSLENGCGVFYCTSLTDFNSTLPSLINGWGMFEECLLNGSSLNNIIHTINDISLIEDLSKYYEPGVITLGLGIPDTSEAKQLIAQECCCNTWEELEQEFTKKGWIAEFQFNGLSTFSMRNLKSSPIYAKLIEIPANKKHFAKYISQDGTKYYNIHWFHCTTGTLEGYAKFASLEEAIQYFNITKKK